jgi:enoyl-CoA hydratase
MQRLLDFPRHLVTRLPVLTLPHPVLHARRSICTLRPRQRRKNLLPVWKKAEEPCMSGYQNILTRKEGAVATITLNRPEALNALNSALMDELSSAIQAFEADNQIRCVVLTGSERAFAAGADIKEMAGKSFSEAYREDFVTRNWEAVTRARKPVIAAVAGYALGGGCELAMMCDFIIAADNAKFGQPEINIGKAKAMEMCLSGRMMDAAEAERAGLVARVVPLANLIQETRATAEKIAAQALPALLMIKECVNAAFETPLAQGIRFERRLFHALFATAEQKEGMAAFIEKRKPVFDRGA